MENNFDIHKWQARYLRENTAKKQVNEQADLLVSAENALEHVKAAWQEINHYKEVDGIHSQENKLNEVEEALVSVAEMLEDILGETI